MPLVPAMCAVQVVEMVLVQTIYVVGVGVVLILHVVEMVLM